MKNYLLFILLAIFTISTGQTLEDLEQAALAKNNVKTKTQIDFKDGEVPSAKTGYNPEGNVLEKSSYSKKGVVTSTEKYEYDDRGNRTYYERSNSYGQYRKNTVYNSNNLITEESGFDGSEMFKNTYKYNAAGKPTEIVYRRSNIIDEKRVYNHSGNTAIVDVLKNGSNLMSKLKLVYDDKGNVIEEAVLSLDGNTVIEIKKYKFEANSNITEEKKIAGGNHIYSNLYTYDAKGRLIEFLEQRPGAAPYAKKKYIYDDSGNLVEYLWRRNKDAEFNSKKYQYDDKGLCTRVDTWYPSTEFRLSTGFEYEFY